MAYQADLTTSRNRGGGEYSSVDIASSRKPVLIFVGNCVVFSDRLLRLVGFEFEDVEVVRLNEVAEVAQLDPMLRNAIQLIVVDETAASLLPDAARELVGAAPGAGAVLAYRTVEIARDILEVSHGSGSSAQLRFLPMKAPIDAWLAALRLLTLGEAFVPSELLADGVVGDGHGARERNGIASQAAVQVNGAETAPDLANLTAREAEILALVAQGERNKTIADTLGLSEHTVKLHVHHIFGKLGVGNRTSATHWFLSQNPGAQGMDGHGDR